MRKLITIILLMAGLSVSAQTTYQLNYDSIRVGKTTGSGATSLYGKTYLKNVSARSVGDSILTIVNGRIFKVPYSGVNFWQRSGTTLSPATAGDDILTTGNVQADSIKRTGGLSTEFLKGDGSVDNTAYAPTSRTISAGFGLSGGGDLSSNRTILADTTALQTVANFFPKGDTRYARTGFTGTVTNVSALTLGTTGTDLSSSVANSTSTPVITLNVPTASASNRGALSSSDWVTFNTKQAGLSGTGLVSFSGSTPSYNTTSSSISSIISDETGSGSMVFSASPTFTGTVIAAEMTTGDITTNGNNKGLYFNGTRNAILGSNAADEVSIVTVNGAQNAVFGTNGLTLSKLSGSGNRIAYVNASGVFGSMVIGSGLSFDGTTLSATGGSSGTITGSGTSGYVPLWNSASDIGNSVISQSGSAVTLAGTLGVGDITTNGNNKGLYFNGTRNAILGNNSTDEISISTANAATVLINSSGLTTKINGSGLYFNGTRNAILGNNATDVVTIAAANADKLTIGASSVVSSVPLSATNLSGTNTGDQTTITGNAGTATALQTARNIQGVSFNGTADINPINGTGFVKATGTTLSYDNNTYLTTSSAASTYAPLNSPTFTGTPSLPTGTIAVTQSPGNNSTAVATTAYVDTKFASTSSRQLKDWYTDANNVTNTETDLYNFTVASNTLSTNGDKLSFRISGGYGGTANSKTLRVYFGNSSFVLSTQTISGSSWVVEGTIIKTDATNYRINISEETNQKAYSYSSSGTVTNYTGTNVFKITGIGGASADITAQMGYLEFKPAAP